MADDNVLTALDAFIAGFGTRSEMPPQMRTVGKVVKSSQPKQDAIDNNNNVKTRKTRTSSDSISLREGEAAAEKREKREEREKDPKVSSTELVSGFSGLTIENIEFCRARNEMRWHLAHGERVPREICSGCRRSITPGQKALDLADDNRVHLADGYECLIRYGERWRRAAREAIARSESEL